ncbi:MAG: hypothetical protein EBU82_05620 [Flavobacteriia bacterium]|nr:hypothetical protein [Flavobacteriia bacterium]
MSGKWVPPHKRGKASTSTFKQTGVRFPSNTTGNNSRNVSYKAAPTRFRNNNGAAAAAETRASKYTKISRQLGTRRIRNKAVKPALKKSKTRLVKSV